MNAESSEREAWKRVEGMLGGRSITLGQHWSYNIYDDPKRLAFVLSRYKFAAKMIGSGARILELGCSEGLAAQVLAELALKYTGVDYDAEAIAAARCNWSEPKITFIEDDFIGKTYGSFDAVVSMDVVEHIERDYEDAFFGAMYRNLSESGIGIIGTPNLTSAAYASAVSQANHVNLYDAERLRTVMLRYFYRVFVFGMNDEIVHMGFAPMSHFLIAVGCLKREEIL